MQKKPLINVLVEEFSNFSIDFGEIFPQLFFFEKGSTPRSTSYLANG